MKGCDLLYLDGRVLRDVYDRDCFYSQWIRFRDQNLGSILRIKYSLFYQHVQAS